LGLLARRLTARGVTASGATLLALLSARLSSAVVPAALARSSCAAAALLAAGVGDPGGAATSLANQVMRTMTAGKLKSAAAVLIGVLGVCTLALVNRAHADPDGPPRATGRTAPQAVPALTGTVLLREQRFTGQGVRVFTLTPDGKTETEFTIPKGLPDAFTPPLDVFRSPDGKRATVRVCDTRPRKKDGKDTPFFPTVLCSFPDGKGSVPIDGELEAVCWSPDGGTLVVREVPPDDTSGAPVGKYLSIDLKTGKRTALPIPDGHWLHDRSPDGKLFLTAGKDPAGKLKGKRVFLVGRDGTVIRPLTDETMGGGPARFGPDGTWVLLRAYPLAAKAVTGTLAWKLYRTGVENPKAELLTDVPDSADVGGFALSPDGKWVAFDRGPRVSADLNPKKSRDPDAETDEVEFAIVVVGSDGKNPRTIRSVKTRKPFSVSLSVIDWR
jgi:hypothetical protein